MLETGKIIWFDMLVTDDLTSFYVLGIDGSSRCEADAIKPSVITSGFSVNIPVDLNSDSPLLIDTTVLNAFFTKHYTS